MYFLPEERSRKCVYLIFSQNFTWGNLPEFIFGNFFIRLAFSSATHFHTWRFSKGIVLGKFSARRELSGGIFQCGGISKERNIPWGDF